MSTPVRASDRDLRALAAIVSQDRPDLQDGEGLPPSLLADLTGQIRCDRASFFGFDSGRKADWFVQELVPSADVPGSDDLERVYWKHYWIASSAAIRVAPATWAASPGSRISTRPGNGIPRPCIPIVTGRWDSSIVSCSACPKRRRELPDPGGTCG